MVVSQHSAKWLAWSLFGLYALIVAATLLLVFFGSGTGDDELVVLAFGYTAVGALVASREPANAIGWLLLAAAVLFGLANFSYAYARDPSLPGAMAVAWFASWSFVLWICPAMMLIPLLFPTGRLLSPTWRIALAVVLAGTVFGIVGGALVENLDVEPSRPNPLRVDGPFRDVVSVVSIAAGALLLTGVLLGAASLIVRLRRSRGHERQQLKVVAYVGAAILIDACVFLSLSVFASSPSAPDWVQAAADNIWLPSLFLVSLGPPLAIGVAILRHRLYGIDVVINRTLVYGALTVTLLVSYLGLFLLLEKLVLGRVTSDSDLAVAGFNAGGGGAVPPGAHPYPGRGGPAVLPAAV